MPRLIVKNIGPVKEVDIELSKVNVFMGPQSCGKSTLAKIISFCSWMEKRKFNKMSDGFLPAINHLCSYHKLGASPFANGSYIQDSSKIAYFGDDMNYFFNLSSEEKKQISPSDDAIQEEVEQGRETFQFLMMKSVNPKVIYIPAERNFVSRVANLGDYNDEEDNLQDFVSNWYEAKAHFSDVHPLKVLDLGVEYFSEDLKTNYVRINPTEKITLNSASSGLQSVIPLLTLLSWLSDGIYQKEKPYSPNEHAELLDFIEKMRNNTTMDTAQKKQFDKMSERLMGFIEGRVYSHTQFIVEEPEQNLFPDTQCELLYSMLEALNHGKKHRMVITTHSPYILYALNNCLLAGLVQDQVPQEVLKEIKCSRAAIAPSLVRVWEIEDGRIKDNGTDTANRTIQDSQGLIRKNYFNQIMQRVMSDYNNLLMFKE